MNRLAWLGVALGLANGAACRSGAEAKPPAPAHAAHAAVVAPGGYERVPEVCRETQQRPRDADFAALDTTKAERLPPAVARTGANETERATVRILSTTPFLFEGVGVTSELWPFPFSPIELTPEAATKLPGLRFGDVVTVDYRPPPIMNSVPPLVVTDIRREPPPVVPVPLLVDWFSEGLDSVRVYADGRVLVSLREEIIQSTLSKDELRAFLATFARARFDDLPSAPDGMTSIEPGQIVLSCARHQRVRVAGHEQALAPVVKALDVLLARAKARQSPILFIAQRIPAVTLLDWPADAPPFADLERLHDVGHRQAAAGDYSSAIFRPLPPAFLKAYTEGRTPGGKSVWVVRDHGRLWMIGDRGCAYGDPVCRPESYDMVRVNLEVKPAPAWAPAFATIAPDGLYYDRVKDARWLDLGGWYSQGDGLYLVEQRLHVPTAKPLRRTG